MGGFGLVEGVAGGVVEGVPRSLSGTRRATTWRPGWASMHPSWGHGPRQVTRPGGDVVSMTWPARHLPRTGTPLVATRAIPSDQRGVQAVLPAVNDLGVRDDSGWKARLTAAAADVEASEEALKLARESRDELVVEASEAMISSRDVARWARLSQSRVLGILAAH